VATDHAPHAPELKDLAFDEAPAGMLGLEEAASLTLEALGRHPTRSTFFRLLSRGPARIAQLRARRPSRATQRARRDHDAGEDANVTVFDPGVHVGRRPHELASRSMNTPYDGRAMTGRVRATIAKGRLVVDEGRLT
jgi:dihydroorotase